LIVKDGFRRAGTGWVLDADAGTSVVSGWRSGTRTGWVDAIFGTPFAQEKKMNLFRIQPQTAREGGSVFVRSSCSWFQS
jgi:hypothetical protein